MVNPLNSTDLFSEVLLIEDEPAHAKLIQRALQETVHGLTHVATGKDALEQLTSKYFELVITDLNLPDTTAIELLRSIREIRPDLPVLVMTSQNDLDIAVQAMREGAWDFMTKQFSPDLANRFRISLDRMANRKLREIREAELTAERDAFWAATNTAEDGVAILGEDGSIVFDNPACVRFIRQIAEGSSEKNLGTLLSKVDERVGGALLSQLSSTTGSLVWTSEFRVPTSGDVPDRFYSLFLSGTSLQQVEHLGLHFTDGRFRRFIVWIKDVTQQKEKERFQRDLLAATTHDLKGPLGAIISSTELLQERDKLPENRADELITRIASSARGCITLIDELLSARKIQDGVLIVKPIWTPIDEVLEDVVLDFFPTAKSRSIELMSKPSAQGLRVYADRLGIRRVLSNLVSNALKFTPTHGLVELSAERVGVDVRISVRDNGSGIAPSERPVLFEKYGRLEKHQGIDGTGLGLFVTKNIVAAHGGTIEVQSEVGKGTCFIVSFPSPE